MTGVLVTALVIAVPGLAFALWPLFTRREGTGTLLALPPDAREELLDRKRAALRALREIDFEHDAGHVSDVDHGELRARYEAEAAAILTDLDRLGAEPAAPEPRHREAPAVARPAWRHPLTATVAALALVGFGIVVGAGLVRNSEPDRTEGPMPGSRPLASLAPSPASPDGGGGRPISPEMLAGMLKAARSSLFEGQYNEAIAAYQAILKRDPRNVDAMTHLGLIVAIGGHADSALETFERALAIDPNYPAALLYRGQVLYEAKQDVAGAIRSWEKFVAVGPPGEDRERVTKLIAEARAQPAKK